MRIIVSRPVRNAGTRPGRDATLDLENGVVAVEKFLQANGIAVIHCPFIPEPGQPAVLFPAKL
jgi:hypothetical protein